MELSESNLIKGDRRLDELALEIHKAIEKHADKEDITLAAAVGVLDLVKDGLIESAR